MFSNVLSPLPATIGEKRKTEKLSRALLPRIDKTIDEFIVRFKYVLHDNKIAKKAKRDEKKLTMNLVFRF